MKEIIFFNLIVLFYFKIILKKNMKMSFLLLFYADLAFIK